MALDNFRTIELIWDKANKSIIKTIKTASSDTTGRYLSVKVLDGGQEVTLNNAKLQLYWEHPNFNTSGTDDFDIVNNGGLFKMTFSEEMLTNIGKLNAHLVLILSDGKITSGGFPIEVIKGADDGVVVPTNGNGLVEQIEKKIDKGNVTLNDLTQEVKLAMTGGSVAIVGENAVGTENLKDGSITDSKLSENIKSSLAVTVDNIVENGDFISGSDGVATGFLPQASTTNPRLVDGVQYWTGSSTGPAGSLLVYGLDMAKGDVYYIRAVTNNVAIIYANKLLLSTNNVDGLQSSTFTLDENYTTMTFRVREINQESSVSKLQVINLTNEFGAGNEPSKDFMDDLIGSVGYFSEFLFDEKWQFNKLMNIENTKIDKADIETDTLTNILTNPDFSNGMIGWVLSAGAVYDKAYPKNNEIAVLPLASLGYGGIYQNVSSSGLKYARFEFYNNGGVINARLGAEFKIPVDIPLNTWGSVSVVTDYSRVFRFFIEQEDVSKINIIRKPIVINLTNEFGAGNEPSKEIMDGIYDGSINEIRLKNSKEHYILAEKVSRLEQSGVGGADYATLYSTDLLKKKVELLTELNNFNETNLMNNSDLRLNKTLDSQNIQISNSLKDQKLILHLHKRENDGYDTVNDVFLPNAEDDFSDVKIIDSAGNALTYDVRYYADDFDVVADSRLGMDNGSKTLVNSYGTIFQKVGGLVSTSTDNGRSWTALPVFSDLRSPFFNFISQDDTIYLTHGGDLYRSEYPYTERTQVLNVSEGYGGTPLIHTNSFVQHPDGDLFTASYQNEFHIRIYKSTDNGKTWTLSLDTQDYQHVHSMYIDTSVTPVAIYAGVDGGGGVYKTTDKGSTWVDLRAINPTMPRSTDFGVIYADPKGYRLLGGETSITGGHSIIKTVDDTNFYPVLSAGSGVACVRNLDGKLFAGGAGKNGFKNAVLYMSNDDGENWTGVYTTSSINDTNGANDGFRYLSNVGDEIFVSTQSSSRPPLRILKSGAYAEIIVNVPQGVTGISVENGHASNGRTIVSNDETTNGEVLLNLPLNEGGRIIKEVVTDTYFGGNYEWLKDGKHLSGFYPPIVSPLDSESLSLNSLDGIELTAENLKSNTGLTISFWGRFDEGTIIDLVTVGDKKLRAIYHQLHYDGSNRLIWNTPQVVGVLNKYDITIASDGSAKGYINGHLQYSSSSPLSDFLSDLNQAENVTVLNTSTTSGNTSLQDFIIRKGVISESDIYDEYHAGVVDNYES